MVGQGCRPVHPPAPAPPLPAVVWCSSQPPIGRHFGAMDTVRKWSRVTAVAVDENNMAGRGGDRAVMRRSDRARESGAREGEGGTRGCHEQSRHTSVGLSLSVRLVVCLPCVCVTSTGIKSAHHYCLIGSLDRGWTRTRHELVRPACVVRGVVKVGAAPAARGRSASRRAFEPSTQSDCAS